MDKLGEMTGETPGPDEAGAMKPRLLSLFGIYRSARTILANEPWKNLTEGQLFGVRIPDSDRTEPAPPYA